jgi:hypothetical protein
MCLDKIMTKKASAITYYVIFSDMIIISKARIDKNDLKDGHM